MITHGKIKGISCDYVTRSIDITLSTDCDPAEAERLAEKDLSIEIKQFRAKRSLDANAYYWVLCKKISESIRESSTFVHNEMLRKYGQIELVDGQAVYLVIPDTDDAQRRVDEAMSYHLRPTSQVKLGKDGKLYRTYMMLRGSSTYNTREMSVLIDGVVTEAKELGIETLTPDQIKEMMIAYEKRYAKRQQ